MALGGLVLDHDDMWPVVRHSEPRADSHAASIADLAPFDKSRRARLHPEIPAIHFARRRDIAAIRAFPKKPSLAVGCAILDGKHRSDQQPSSFKQFRSVPGSCRLVVRQS